MQQNVYDEEILKILKRKNPFYSKDILSQEQFNKENIEWLFKLAHMMKQMVDGAKLKSKLLENYEMAALFYEPSTRTMTSFLSAMHHLGGKTVQVLVQNSSVVKGESFEDTVRTIEQYSDIITIRHPLKGSVKMAADVAKIPVINAGDGIGEHPTQSLLDLFTIYEEKKRISGIKIAMVGDLMNGRTVHSLTHMLANYQNVEFYFVSPRSLQMTPEILLELKDKNIKYTETQDLESVIDKVDVLYVTRIQKERFAAEEDYKKVKGCYVITPQTLEKAKSDMIIMHPLPRVDEISAEVDNDKRAVYFKQMRNGLFVRMALLASILIGEETDEFF